MNGDQNSYWRGDIAIAAVAVCVCICLGLAGQPSWVWSAGMGAALAIRRTTPLVFADLVVTVSMAHLFVEASLLFPGDAVLLVAAYTVAAHTRGRLRVLGPVLGLGYVIVLTIWTLLSTQTPDRGSAGMVMGLIAVGLTVAWAAGRLELRRNDALWEAQHQRMLSERDAAAQSRLAAYEEREHISDEMHDVLAHTLTGIIVQAESGRAISPPGEVGDLFTRISETSRSALLEVRGLLAPNDHRDLRPSPGLEELGALLEGFRRSGLAIDLEVTGQRSELTAGKSLAIYRIIQESLTNALRHSSDGHALLVIDWTADLLSITVSNAMSTQAAASGVVEHRGLAGMRRRCAFHGGAVRYEAGEVFIFTAALPLTEDAVLPVADDGELAVAE